MPWSSNYTFLGHIDNGPEPVHIVYKPIRGEQPLWDFPRGTLAKRETAAYVVSRALRWNLVPPTVLRRGPHGLGSVQFFADIDQDAHFFTFHKDPGYRHLLQALALFDIVTNNADRKAGHCLAAPDGRIVAIDQGLCFSVEPKLRTVVWDFTGELIPDRLAADLRRLRADVDEKGTLVGELSGLLSRGEIVALERRVAELLKLGHFPDPPEDRRPYPWPLV
jgi:uncharacterized repeat protein (TIGR03843 family)